MKQDLNLTLGALPSPDGTCSFRVWAPLHESLALELYQSREQPRQIIMDRDQEGYFTTRITSLAPDTLYYYCFADKQKRPDPASRFQPEGVTGPSAVVNPAFPWSDLNWINPGLDQYIIYELHVGTYTPEGTFAAIIPHLAQLKDLGITAIELMPVAQFSGDRNWGYDGVSLYAVQNSYGGPNGLKELVNTCHQQGIAVILDVVYNHIGPEGNSLAEFGPYFTQFYTTPWGSAINFDGAHNHLVRRYFIENALHWFKEYHMDALRLDALHAIYDGSAYTFLSELADCAHTFASKQARKFYLIGESDLNDTRLILPKSKGGFNLDAQWNDDFHHALHTLLTNESKGYYQDFGQLSHFIKAYKEGYVYSGQYSPSRQKPHGCSSKKIPSQQFVVFGQNHDQVGNRLKGDRNSQSLSLPKLKLAAGLVILSPYIPLLFMGEEYAETAPFYYFTSFSNENLITAVRQGRQQEFAAFSWAEKIPDPHDPKTFWNSKLNHNLKYQAEHNILLRYYTKLIQLRKSNGALSHLNKKEIEINLDATSQVVTVQRKHKEQIVLLLFHFNPDLTTVTLPIYNNLKKIFDSADAQWGGEGSKVPEAISETDGITLSLPPFAFVVFTNNHSK